MNSFCVKCRRSTATQEEQVMRTKNNKFVAKGKCSVCGGKKSRFLSAKEGEGLLGNILGVGKLPILGDLPLVGALF